MTTALLTGATGFVGASLLAELLGQTSIDVVCLVRASDAAATTRVQGALDAQGLWRPGFGSRIRTVDGDLSRPALGLPPPHFARLSDEIDVVYHTGAQLNLFAPYRVLEPANVNGTQELLHLAALGRPKPFHHVSSLAVFGTPPGSPTVDLEEAFRLPDAPPDTSGYARSKWAAERLVSQAADRGLAASIYRPGRITGHSETGVCNARDALSLMITGCVRLGVAPALDAVIHLTPVDVVSRAIAALSRSGASGQAFHLINPEAIAWHQVIEVLRALGHVTSTVPFDEWRGLVRRRESGLDRLSVLVSRPQPPFSAVRRRVADAHARSGFPDLAYPADQAGLLRRYVSHLSCAAAV